MRLNSKCSTCVGKYDYKTAVPCRYCKWNTEEYFGKDPKKMVLDNYVCKMYVPNLTPFEYMGNKIVVSSYSIDSIPKDLRASGTITLDINKVPLEVKFYYGVGRVSIDDTELKEYAMNHLIILDEKEDDLCFVNQLRDEKLQKTLKQSFLTFLAMDNDCRESIKELGNPGYNIKNTTFEKELIRYIGEEFNENGLLICISFHDTECYSSAVMTLDGRVLVTVGTPQEFINACESMTLAW